MSLSTDYPLFIPETTQSARSEEVDDLRKAVVSEVAQSVLERQQELLEKQKARIAERTVKKGWLGRAGDYIQSKWATFVGYLPSLGGAPAEPPMDNPLPEAPRHRHSSNHKRALEQLQSRNLPHFVALFNSNPDRRELYRLAWERRYESVTQDAQSADRISSARESLSQLWLCQDSELVSRALDQTSELIENDPYEVSTAEDLLRVEKNLLVLLHPTSMEELTTEVQESAARTYGLILESMLLHYSYGHLNAVTKETRESIWKRAKDLHALNQQGNPRLNFYLWYAEQGAQRLKDNESELQGMLRKLIPLAQAGVTLASIAAKPEAAISLVTNAYQEMSVTLALVGWEAHSYDMLLMIKTILRIAEIQPGAFDAVERIVRQVKSKEAEADPQLLYGILEFLEHAVLHSTQLRVKEEALKLIALYTELTDERARDKAYSVLFNLQHHASDTRLAETARGLLTLLLEDGASSPLQAVYEHPIRAVLYRKMDLYEVPALNQSLRDLLPICSDQSARFLYKFVEDNAHIESQSASRLNRLYEAAKKGNLNQVRSLLREGLDPFGQDSDGNSPLLIAAANGHAKVVNYLLRKVPGTAAQCNYDGQNALHLACARGNTEMIRLLLSHGMHIDQQDFFGRTGLHYAVQAGSAELVHTLLDHGAYLRAQTEQGSTALHLAALHGHLDIMRLLLEAEQTHTIKSLANARDHQGLTATHYVAKGGSKKGLAMLKLLHQYGADLSAKDHSGANALHFACGSGALHLAGPLTSILPMDSKDKLGNTPLHWACEDGRIESVIWLLHRGANRNVRNQRDETPIMYAAAQQHGILVEKLLQNRAHVLVHDENKHGLIHRLLAESRKNQDLIQLLLRYRPDLILAEDGERKNMLHYCAEQGNWELAQDLIKCLPYFQTDAAASAYLQKRALGKTAKELAIENGHRDFARRIDNIKSPEHDVA